MPVLCSTKPMVEHAGSAICAFEESKMPAGRAVFHIRVHKILEPVSQTIDDYDGHIPIPKEGELLSHDYGATPARYFVNDGDNHSTGLRYLLGSQATGHILRIAPQPTPSSAAGNNPNTPSRNLIHTVHPDKLTPTHFIDLSGRLECCLRLPGRASNVLPRFQYHRLGQGFTPFPLGAHGFFYCNTEWELPELRFRAMASADPGTFARGHDLLLPNGLPWRTNIAQLAKRYAALGEMMGAEGLLDPAAFPLWRNEELPVKGGSHIVHIGQEFEVDCSARARKTWLAYEGRVYKVTVLDAFWDARWKMAPYSGASLRSKVLVCPARADGAVGMIWCCFERHEGPENTLSVVLRITKIVKPIKRIMDDYDGWVGKPVEGDLLLLRRHGVHKLASWDLAKRPSFATRISNGEHSSVSNFSSET